MGTNTHAYISKAWIREIEGGWVGGVNKLKVGEMIDESIESIPKKGTVDDQNV